MGKLLPNRHPNKDFFILDVKDASPKDDIASMEHPVFSLSTKPDMRELDYSDGKGRRLRVIPSGRGLATIMDKDIILFCISKLVAQKNDGHKITPIVEASAHEIMVACNWMTSKPSYERFENAMIRLNGTQIITDIETGGQRTTNIFKLVDAAEIVRKEEGAVSPFGRLSKVRITLSDWTFRAVESMEVLSINTQYFRLRRPLERRLYEIARKHVGRSNSWTIGIQKLRAKVGTNAPLKKFRYNLKKIISSQNIPDYRFEMEGDNVVIFGAQPMREASKPAFIPIRPDTLDKAQAIAAQIGVSVFDLEREWNEWNEAQCCVPDKPDGAFIGFCKQKLASAGAVRVVEARKDEETFKQLGMVFRT